MHYRSLVLAPAFFLDANAHLFVAKLAFMHACIIVPVARIMRLIGATQE